MSEQKTIAEVASSGAMFLMPDYQRGYRWGDIEVHDLLCDIDEMSVNFSPSAEGEAVYCLQPVVFDASEKGKGRLIVVDGQQRLTTLFLLMHYIKKMFADKKEAAEDQYSKAEIAHLTQTYQMQYMNNARQNAFTAMISALDSTDEINTSNIDMYYMTRAYQTIKMWAARRFEVDSKIKIKKVGEFAQKLYDHTTVIWYEIDESTDGKSGDYFAKINSGKIPLTNSELIKAAIMLDEYALPSGTQDFAANTADPVLAAQQEKDFYEIKRKQLDNERLKMARQWDEIEEILRNREFWSFISQENDKYNDTRIDFLFDMVADEKYGEAFKDESGNEPPKSLEDFRTLNKDRGTFVIISRYLEKQRKEASYMNIPISVALWKEVWDKYMTLKEWFMDRPFYHYVGYIILFCNDDAASLLRKAKGKGRKEIKKAFLNLIRKDIAIKSGTSKDDFYAHIDSLDYENDKDYIKKVLVLFNIISILNDSGTETTATRDTFFPFARYREEDWNLEHIHSRADGAFTKKSAKSYMNYLDKMIENLEPKNGSKESSDYKTLKDCKAVYDKALKDGKDEKDAAKECADAVAAKFDAAFDNDDTLNGICNMALLDDRTNKSYGNLPFFMKRMVIKDVVSGKNGNLTSRFIPLCTRNVFDKSYSKIVDNMLHWTKEDGAQYALEIKDALWQYLGAQND